MQQKNSGLLNTIESEKVNDRRTKRLYCEIICKGKNRMTAERDQKQEHGQEEHRKAREQKMY